MANSPYLRRYPHPNSSRLALVQWAARMPFASRKGERRIAQLAAAAWPDTWAQDMAGSRVLIVGSGPSLDRVSADFFASFDTALYINFAFERRWTDRPAYFFTTDMGPAVQFAERFGREAFAANGAQRCVIAPVFYDQPVRLTDEFLSLFTFVQPQHSEWRIRKGHVGGRLVPQTIARHPVQPRWESYALPDRAEAVVPVVDYTSALTAMVFAAINGAQDISLIGCDFSAGRAQSVDTVQQASGAATFGDARGEYDRIAAMLERHGVAARNLSWEV